MPNYHRHPNAVPVAALARWILVAFFLGAVGLSYVYFKNQLHAAGDEIRNLERESEALVEQDTAVRLQISTLSSRPYLQKRLAEGFIHLKPITDTSIVRMGNSLPGVALSELRPVSNEDAAR